MLEALLGRGGGLRLLCLGAHSDDVEIGAGGTVAYLLDRYPGSSVTYVVFSADAGRAEEARESAGALLDSAAARDVRVLGFRENHFPFLGGEIREAFGELATTSPDLVFTHARDDLHQDHRLVSELTWNFFRDHLVLEYEVPKYDGDLGRPNLFVPLERDYLQRKLDHLGRHFSSQRSKPWYDEQTFRGLMRLRGVECRAASGYAEAFHARKLVLA